MGRYFSAFNGWARRLRKASTWHARAQMDAAVEKDPEFQKWVGEARNKAAWDTVDQLWELLEQNRDEPELLVIRSQARNAVHLPFLFVRKPLWRFAVSAAAVLAIAIASVKFFSAETPVTYSTAVGQRQIVTLSDGSRIALDALSSVTVTQMHGKARTLSLNEGRAHFDVAHDPSRPFRVSIDNQVVTAVGTEFNIEKLTSKTLVTLTQGRIAVGLDQTATYKSYLLAPGQELIVKRSGAAEITLVDPRTANAWERGQIVLNDERLDDAAEQLNRYLTKPLLVDPAVANMRISGVFNVSEIKAFVATITSYFPLQAEEERGYIRLQQRS